MKKAMGKKSDELRPAYDLTKLKGGVRGKYAQRARRADFIKFLDASPDVPPQPGDESPK